jgi:DNA-binding winged helix-turn-helix (wHTH) protein/TolB-like protein/Tfp pilus assembly protein PilF
MNERQRPLYRFGPFSLDPKERVLSREGEPVPLTPKVFDALLALVESSGQLIKKEVLINRLWPDAIVEERGLTQNIFLLRKALGDNGGETKYIETVPKHGYRFIAEVTLCLDEQTGLIVQRRIRASLSLQEATETAAAEPQASPGRWRKRRLQIALASLAIAATFVGLAAGYWSGADRAGRGAAAPQIKSLAVLPFKVLGEDDDKYLAVGIADVLITRLGKFKQLSVRPTSAILRYEATNPDPVKVAREQVVDAVLEGSIHKMGDRVRVTVRLVSARDGTYIWAEQLDEKAGDNLAVEDVIFRHIIKGLALTLDPEQKQRLARSYTHNAEAHRLYILGRHFFSKRDGEGTRKAITYFKQAIELDPAYALAYAGLADTYAFLGSAYFDALPPKEDMPKAKAAATRALELDETLAEAHCALAYVLGWFDHDWPGAERELKRSLELNPNYATAHQRYGWYLLARGQLDAALEEMKRAQELDPLSPPININIGAFLYHQRRYDEALAQFESVVELAPDFGWNHAYLGMAYLQKGDYAGAISELRQEKIPWEQSVWVLAVVYARSGRPKEARKILSRFHEFAQRRYVSPTAFILIYAALGDKDQAFAWLERAYEERDWDLGLLNVDPKLDSLRSDPRFANLLNRVGFAR